MDRMTDRLLFVSDYEERVYREKVGAPRAATASSTTACGPASLSRSTAADAADFLYIGMMRDLKGPDIFHRRAGRGRTAHSDGG
jgi:hypothetical protein